jgi:hypothetical protein
MRLKKIKTSFKLQIGYLRRQFINCFFSLKLASTVFPPNFRSNSRYGVTKSLWESRNTSTLGGAPEWSKQSHIVRPKMQFVIQEMVVGSHFWRPTAVAQLLIGDVPWDGQAELAKVVKWDTHHTEGRVDPKVDEGQNGFRFWLPQSM